MQTSLNTLCLLSIPIIAWIVRCVISVETLQAASIIIANCIGSGAFTSPTILLTVGVNAFYGWVITGIGALSLGLIFLILAEYSKKSSIHEIIASGFDGSAKIIRFLVFYLFFLFAGFSNAALVMLVDIGLSKAFNSYSTYAITLLFIYLLNALGIEESEKINLTASLIKTGLLIFLPILAITNLHPIVQSFPRETSSCLIISASFKTLWPFVGVECIAIDSGVPIPQLKKGLLLGIVTCLIIYMLNTYAMFYYMPNLKNFSVADQGLIKKLAPSLCKYFNGFIVFIGLSCLHGWVKTLALSCRSGGELAPARLKTYANPIICMFSFISTCMIKKYCNTNSFDFIFDLATVLLVIIYSLGIIAFGKLWVNRKIHPSFYSKTSFFAGCVYLMIMITSIGINLYSFILPR